MDRERTQSPRKPAGTIAKLSTLGMAVVIGALTLGTAGCYARASTGAALVYTEPVVEVQTVPAQIEYYPSYVYRGSNVYLVDGQWYYRARGRWVVYRSEPRVLADVRVRYEHNYGRHYRPRPEMASPPPRRPHRH